MIKRLALIGLLSMLSTSAAYAANCSAYTYTLTNGTSADANQVMSNFNTILNCGNNNLAPIASPHFTGSVGIGTSTPTDVLDVTNSVVFGPATERLSLSSGSIGFNRKVATGAIYNSSAYAFQVQHNGSTVAASDQLQFQTYTPAGAGGPVPLILNAAGAVGISGGPNASYNFYVNGSAGGTSGWNVPSDARLKKNVEPISNGLALVKQLRGVRYDWRPANEREIGKSLPLPTNERQIGFIAQEVEKVVPEAVTKPKDATGTYGLKEENLIPILVEAIKEQQSEIEKLRAAVAALTPTTQR